MPDPTPHSDRLTVSVHRRISEITEAEWDACACPEARDGARPNDPFTTHRFLKALEDSGSIGGMSGWDPVHIVVRRTGQIAAVMPLYAKHHSQGEYVFDHGWANAFSQAGGDYYPKLQATVPFTPATGRRFLTRPDLDPEGFGALASSAVELLSQNGLSSLHVTFCTEEEAEAGRNAGFLHRTGEQFHWMNDNYSSFGEFLRALSSRKRKNIRQERSRANGFGGKIRLLSGSEIRPDHWDAFWEFYQDTGSRKWGTPYLTRRFFDEIHDTMRRDILLVMCERNGRPVAGALNFVGSGALYGRYWGCIEHHSCLHFEVCYYRAIEYAIGNRLSRVEAGAQGPHKLARGYMPVKIHSLHWIAHPGFRKAVLEYLEVENQEVSRVLEILSGHGPFRKGNDDAKAGTAH